jgi:hypothetical protein
MGVHYFAAIDGDWADDAESLAEALRADWPAMRVTRASGSDRMAYDLEFEGELGSVHADGRCISFKRAGELVIRLAVWWRRRVPGAVRLVVFDDSSAVPVDVPTDATVEQVRRRVVEAETEGFDVARGATPRRGPPRAPTS